MADEKLGPTGKFPRGQMHPSDRGELTTQVGSTRDGKVLVMFGTEVSWLGLDPQGARDLADMLSKAADDADATLKRKAAGG